ncbi:MAG: hypothetical protein HC877_04740 [Thioploca sp.]|nr:hypothetical protein [Thioploca sp.]
MQQGIGKPENLPKILEMTSNMIKDIGLNLKTEKTRIREDDTPFEFLGYEIQRGKGIRLNPKIIKRARQKCQKSISYGRRQNRVLKEINPILRGVYNYAGYFSNGKMWNQLGKMRFKIAKRFHKVCKEYGENKIVSYKEVNKTVNYIPPQEPTIWQNPQYWNARNLKGLKPRKKLLWKRQKGICEPCRSRFGYDSSMLQIHHLKEKSKGGRDKNSNVVLIHKECHETLHNL